LIQKLLPNPLLRSFVKEYWLLNLSHGSGVPMRMSPVPEQCLYFYPKNQPQPIDINGNLLQVYDNVMMGQAVNGHVQLIIPDGYCMFKILFQHGGMNRLFGVPMSFLTNTYEETSAVLGASAALLRDQIGSTIEFTEMALHTDAFLLKQLSKTKNELLPIDFVINQNQLHLRSIDSLASDACLSSRQFERKFLERIGVSPKMYQRIIRFNQAMKLKNANPNTKWIDITYACGYYDQMHLLRDFKLFTGSVPTGFDFSQAIIY
jgi:AraC-like DNA-binding protein